MLAAGADVAGISEPLRRIGQGWLAFDRCLATPAIMYLGLRCHGLAWTQAAGDEDRQGPGAEAKDSSKGY